MNEEIIKVSRKKYMKKTKTIAIPKFDESAFCKEFPIIDIKTIEIEDKFIRVNSTDAEDVFRVELLTGLSISDLKEKIDFGILDGKILPDGTFLISQRGLYLRGCDV